MYIYTHKKYTKYICTKKYPKYKYIQTPKNTQTIQKIYQNTKNTNNTKNTKNTNNIQKNTNYKTYIHKTN